MKKILLLSFTVLVIPQIVFAAWWNPFSWFNNWSFSHKSNNETQILEDRVKELEKKLDSMATSTPASVMATSTDKVVSNTATTTATTTKIMAKTTVKPKTETSQNIKVEPPKKEVKTFTLPSGAVIDDAGNIISPPTNITSTTNTQLPVAGARVLTGEEIYSVVSPSVALILGSNGNGSGFFINDGRYTITNHHVLENEFTGEVDKVVNIKLSNGVIFEGTVLGTNKNTDLALIFNGNQRPPATILGSSGDSLKIGTDVYALGYPRSISKGLTAITFTKGTLSAKQIIGSKTYLQMDAAINSGNSGGPLVNNKGEVIGINTWGFATPIVKTDIGYEADVIQGIAFAVPIQEAINLIPQLSQYGQSRYEVYPIGSIQTINRSAIIKIGFNEALPCTQLGFTGNDLTICNLYKDHYKDYQWNVKENL